MDIFGTLKLNESVEIDQQIIDCAARVIQQYALEDGLINNGSSDEKLEVLMRTAERYLKRYTDVSNAHAENPNWVSVWQNQQMVVFNNHASAYEVLYRSVSHMQAPPYFMTQWSICFLVDAVLKEHKIETIEQYLTLSRIQHEDIDYTIRFCENLLQSIHSEFIGLKS